VFFLVKHIGENFFCVESSEWRGWRLGPGSSGSRGDEPVTQGGESRLLLV
jgi:hypothetical protein